jgi:hypothetical protein
MRKNNVQQHLVNNRPVASHYGLTMAQPGTSGKTTLSQFRKAKNLMKPPGGGRGQNNIVTHPPRGIRTSDRNHYFKSGMANSSQLSSDYNNNNSNNNRGGFYMTNSTRYSDLNGPNSVLPVMNYGFMPSANPNYMETLGIIRRQKKG